MKLFLFLVESDKVKNFIFQILIAQWSFYLTVKLYRFRKLLSQPQDAANSLNAVFDSHLFGINYDEFARDVMLLLSLLGNFLHQIIYNYRHTRPPTSSFKPKLLI